MKRTKKEKGTCHFADCKKIGNYGFMHRKSKNIQVEKYCREHVYLIKSNKAFPECRIIKLTNKNVIVPPNILGSLDFVSEGKQKEIMKELLLR